MKPCLRYDNAGDEDGVENIIVRFMVKDGEVHGQSGVLCGPLSPCGRLWTPPFSLVEKIFEAAVTAMQ